MLLVCAISGSSIHVYIQGTTCICSQPAFFLTASNSGQRLQIDIKRVFFYYLAEDLREVAKQLDRDLRYNLVVPDGTWRQARKIFKKNEILQNARKVSSVFVVTF